MSSMSKQEAKEKLKEAKELFDIGVITIEEFNHIKSECLQAMGMNLPKTTTPPPNPSDESPIPSSSNPLVEPPIEDNPLGGNPLGESSSQTILGTVPEASNPLETSNRTILGEVETVPENSNPLDSNSQTILGAVPEEVANPLGSSNATIVGEAPYSGLTIMGKSIELNHENLTKLPTGAMFDNRYTIVEPLGEGGMGMVYQAIDKNTKQLIALKVLRPELAKNKQVIDSLVQEVSLGQKLNHPHLLQIRHLGVGGDTPYVVMELMDGGDVEEMLASRGGKLSIDETLKIVKAATSALSALHQESVVHLDIKPENILLSKSGLIRLADFGISS